LRYSTFSPTSAEWSFGRRRGNRKAAEGLVKVGSIQRSNVQRAKVDGP
jgi:hypothetical protein